jgi:RNA ligase
MNSLKYNRTFHLPWSKGATKDDKISSNISKLIGVPIVISEKIDGSNTCLETNSCFARTHSGPPTHLSFDGFKSLHAEIKFQIPKAIQIFGEWVYAIHSIKYDALPGYFLLFNIRDLSNMQWASWEEVELWAEELCLPTVPVLFKGQVSSEKELKELTESFMNTPSQYGDIKEGVVVRVQKSFNDENFPFCVAKMVQANHVQTSIHWKEQEIVKNKLSKNKS